MKILKVILVLLFLISLSNSLFSQTFDHYDREIRRVQFIVKGGVNMSNTTRVVHGGSGKESLKIGYKVGALADIYIGKGLYIQPGATLSTKGSRIKNMPTSAGGKTNLSMSTLYLQIPVLLAFKVPVGNTATQSFNFAVGPYYGYGLSGDISGSNFEKIETFGDEGVCKNDDWGLNVQVQYEASKFFLCYGAEIGFTSIMRKDRLPGGFSSKIKNYDFSFGVGYKF